jgi:hypothetical protein
VALELLYGELQRLGKSPSMWLVVLLKQRVSELQLRANRGHPNPWELARRHGLVLEEDDGHYLSDYEARLRDDALLEVQREPMLRDEPPVTVSQHCVEVRHQPMLELGADRPGRSAYKAVTPADREALADLQFVRSIMVVDGLALNRGYRESKAAAEAFFRAETGRRPAPVSDALDLYAGELQARRHRRLERDAMQLQAQTQAIPADPFEQQRWVARKRYQARQHGYPI